MRETNNYTRGPVWDEDLERYLVEVRLPNGRRLRKRFRAERPAQRWWNEQMARIESGTWDQLAPKNVLLGTALDTYREYAKAHHRSYRTYTAPVLTFWEKEFRRDRPLAKISRAQIEGIKLRRVGEVSPSTVDKSLAVLKAFFNWCDVQGIFHGNPVRKIKFFNPNNELVRYLTVEQYERLLREAQEIRWYLAPLIVLAVHTGLRRGNLLNLRWEEIDLAARALRITEMTKNKRTLTVPLNDTAYATLLELKKKSGETACVFPHFQGERAGEAIQDIKNSWRTALTNAGIKNFRWHDLRHCFASWLVMSGASLPTVQHLLGHRSITMTLRYAHLSPKFVSEEIKALDRMLPFSRPLGALKRGKPEHVQARSTTRPTGAKPRISNGSGNREHVHA